MSRLKVWGILLVSSIVSLVSLLGVLDDRKEDNWQKYEKWIVSVCSISIICSFFGALASMLPPETSMKVESPLITVCLGIWAAGMPALLDPNHDLAVGVGYGISNANLYFFGWGAMVAAICLAGDFAKQANGDEASPVALKWILLGADSLIIMGTASGVYKDSDCKNANDPSESWNDFCTRTNFAVYFGLCSAVLALSVAAFKQAPFICHTVVALIMLVAWCCAVAFLTFGSGPGTNLGNIYFATWIGFFLTLNLTTTSVRYLIGKGDDAEGPAATEGGEAGPSAAKSVGKQSADPPGDSAPAGDLEKGGSEEEETP